MTDAVQPQSTTTTSITPMDQASSLVTSAPTEASSTLAFMHDAHALDHMARLAGIFAKSTIVPPDFQGKPESCMVALMYAQQLGEHPMTIFQSLYVIKGRPATTARFAIARANTSGLLQGPIRWRSQGKATDGTLMVQAYATFRETGEEINSTISLFEAQQDGWTANPKYRSMPEHMLRLRSAMRLIKMYLPEVLFGMTSIEELETSDSVVPARVEVAPEQPSDSAPAATIAEKAAAAADKARRRRRKPADQEAVIEVAEQTAPASEAVDVAEAVEVAEVAEVIADPQPAAAEPIPARQSAAPPVKKPAPEPAATAPAAMAAGFGADDADLLA